VSHPRFPDRDDNLEALQLRLESLPSESGGFPVFTPLVSLGIARGAPNQAGVAQALNRAVERGHLESGPAGGAVLGFLQNGVSVARTIDDAQEDLDLDGAKGVRWNGFRRVGH